MKVLTASEMREVDRRTIEEGIPGIILMENAGSRVVDLIVEKFSPLQAQRITILCGKGNNGGDGLVVARQLYTRFRPGALDVVLFADPGDLKGDAAENLRMLRFCGCAVHREIAPSMRNATIVVDALLGTGISGPATGAMLNAIREINSGFPMARVVAVDIPSGMPSDSGEPAGEHARADYTVTFTAPKFAHALPPNCDNLGELRVVPIGSPDELMAGIRLALIRPEDFRHLLAPRARGGHKGTYGHVLAVAGSRGKSGAAAMTGIGALRSGAGLVTVASPESAISAIAAHAPEIMTEPLPESESGSISTRSFDYGRLPAVIQGKTVVVLGPGLGQEADAPQVVSRLLPELKVPLVIDADGLNALAKLPAGARPQAELILTPHPGEMSRLVGRSTAEIAADRIGAARSLAAERGAYVVLKGQRTLVSCLDGRVWINPTGTPAMGTGGTGDILSGMIGGLLAQFPKEIEVSLIAAVYLHGLAGEIGAEELGELPLVATDLLRYLPAAMEECARVSHCL